MYSVKKNVLIVAASLKAYGIDHVVLSPGSRNAPLIHTFSQDSYFHCYTVVDERSAAFFALGLIQKLRRPVAICCTSGTALLNYASAVAEACYQQLPLIVISADRSAAWIGQMDGQTIPQLNVFSSLVKKSVQLPEINHPEEQWYCQRLVHEAILASTYPTPSPVHINVPLSEPLFDFSALALPNVKPIKRWCSQAHHSYEQLQQFKKRLIIVGQLPQNNGLTPYLEQLVTHFDCVVLTEHLANVSSPLFVSNFDLLLSKLSSADIDDFVPDLLITLGGHIVSKRLKQFLRAHQPQAHWSLAQNNELVDLYQCVTDLIDAKPETFLADLLKTAANSASPTQFTQHWYKASNKLNVPLADLSFGDIAVMGAFIEQLPENSALHLANSSPVRNAQLFSLKPSIEVFCNRGTNGIDGTLSTAVGFAAIYNQLTFLVIGDLSFFYELNVLTSQHLSKNLRILLINNGGGGIFHLLPGLDKSAALNQYIATEHQNKAKNWVLAAGIDYLEAHDFASLQKNLPLFINQRTDKPILFEVSTSIDANISVLNNMKNNYYDKH